MGATQILKQIDNSQQTLRVGKEQFTIKTNKSDVKKGVSVDKIIEELKKASKENLLQNNNAFN